MYNYEFEICDYSNPKHVKALNELLNDYMADPMGDYRPHSELEQQRLVEALASHPSATVVLASNGSEYVGMSTCFELLSTFYIKPYLYIHDFCVSSKFRHKGVGRALMNKVVEVATERNCCKITLEVRIDNTSAMLLYKDFGFEPCEPDMFFWTKKL